MTVTLTSKPDNRPLGTLAHKGSLLVIEGPIPLDYDILAAIEADRADRDAHILGQAMTSEEVTAS